MSRVPRIDGRGRDPRHREPADTDVAPRPRGREAVDRNQNAWPGTLAGGQLSLSQVRVPQVVRAAGLTNAEADGEFVSIATLYIEASSAPSCESRLRPSRRAHATLNRSHRGPERVEARRGPNP